MSTYTKFLNNKLAARVLCCILAAVLCLSCAVCLSSCSGGNDEFPVTVGNITINEEPKNVVALSDNAADIICAIGYATKLVGRSDECTQPDIAEFIESVGAEQAPDVQKIKELKADIVFAEPTLSAEKKTELKNAGLTVITTELAPTMEELEILYKTIGKVLGGNKTGLQKAEKAFNNLTSNINGVTSLIPDSDILNTACYLYLVEGQILSTLLPNTFEESILANCGVVNVTKNNITTTVDAATLKVFNPTFIFCDTQQVLDYLKNDNDLKSLSALTNKKAFLLPKSELERQGYTLADTYAYMIKSIYPETDSTPDYAIADPNAIDMSSVAAEYGIDITDDMVLSYEQTSDDIKILQKRLINLGYLDLDVPTDYYGEMTVAALLNFIEASGLEGDGKTADSTILTAVFATDAKKKQ
ncbi:MAG: ABC transporter substrate-binding protein [Oscillospiraceae bacterium]|nr:ABC transporter substrate-binding protein [Oscillospiraceae bacterium]